MQEKASQFLASLTTACGVYQMFDAQGAWLYIGKASNLKKRLSSYFQKKRLSTKTAQLMGQVSRITVIVTHNEKEALLLENQLIKQHSPKYNVLLRDDKSYPFILFSSHAYPSIKFYRQGKKNPKGKIFGPFPDALAVQKTLKLLQKIFKLRTCPDTVFKNRKRPCLLYALKKCSAPCMGWISTDNYQKDIKHAQALLQGKNQAVMDTLVKNMQTASTLQHYETAARLRDQITALRTIQTPQSITHVTSHVTADIFMLLAAPSFSPTVIGVLSICAGTVSGSALFYPDIKKEVGHTLPDILSAFIAKYYLSRTSALPKNLKILTNIPCTDQAFLEKALGVSFMTRPSIKNKKPWSTWLETAQKTTQQALESTLASKQIFQQPLKTLRTALNISSNNHDVTLPVLNIACFDISHTFGESPIGGCIFFNDRGFQKKYYRRFLLQDLTPGDDYAAISATVKRYLELFLKHFKNQPDLWPDVFLIDGGKGQLSAIKNHLKDHLLAAPKPICLLGIAKGPLRKPGQEKIFKMDSASIHLLPFVSDSEAFHILQRLRDEAHRFALQSHRKKRAKTRKTSWLETIAGIGPRKRRALLDYLGGWEGVKKSSPDQLMQVPGIHKALAEKIYAAIKKTGT